MAQFPFVRVARGSAVGLAMLFASLQPVFAQAPNPLVGRWDGRWANDEIEVTLRPGLGGRATLNGSEYQVRVSAQDAGPPRVVRGKLAGEVLGERRELDFTATLENPTTVVLNLPSAGETYRLARQGGTGRNPLAPAAGGGGGGGSGWPGTFTSDQNSFVLADQFEGDLSTNGATYPLVAVEASDQNGRRLDGRFRVGDDLFEVVVKMSGRTLVLETGGAQHTLERRGDAPAPAATRPAATPAATPAGGAATPANGSGGGIVVLKNGEVMIGRVEERPNEVVVRWPYGERTQPGEMSVPKTRIRWFSRETDSLPDAYWTQFADEPIDSAWHPARDHWRRAHAPAGQATVAHVRAGQRWVFRMQQGMQSVYTVRAVDASAGTVSYSIQTMMNGAPVGEPTFVEWGSTAFEESTGQGQGQAKVSRQRLRIAGRDFDCLVVQVPGQSTSWTPMAGDTPIFPGVLKAADGSGVVIMELERID